MEHHNSTISTEPQACIKVQNNVCNSFVMVNMASGVDHERVPNDDNNDD